MVADKNWGNVFKILPKNAEYYFTKANIPRAMDENKLRDQASLFGLNGIAYPALTSALFSAKSNAKQGDIIIILGSIYLVGDIF